MVKAIKHACAGIGCATYTHMQQLGKKGIV